MRDLNSVSVCPRNAIRFAGNCRSLSQDLFRPYSQSYFVIVDAFMFVFVFACVVAFVSFGFARLLRSLALVVLVAPYF